MPQPLPEGFPLISPPVPPPCKQVFAEGISHPDLYLWDSWSCECANGIDLYCLALARFDQNGDPISPSARNNYDFHIRRFHSADDGMHWSDEGCFQQPGQATDSHDARNIWSGSVLNLGDTGKLCAYTGIQQGNDEHPFIQSLAVGHSGHEASIANGRVVLCPVNDREQILAAGYYLPAPHLLGSKDGEEGGPILAWRDPFLFQDVDGKLMMAWAAKASPARGAMGLASLTMDDQYNCSVESLFPPIAMPDDSEFTQLEVPKIQIDANSGKYLLYLSTTNRKSESQPQSEVSMAMRLYTSEFLTKGWTPLGTGSSIIEGVKNQFGMSVIKTDYEKKVLQCVAPYTENAGKKLQLTFPPGFVIDLKPSGKIERILAKRENV